MEKQIKKRKIIYFVILCIVIVALCVVYIGAVIHVNRLYPKAAGQTHGLNETFNWSDFNITATKYDVLTQEELKQRWDKAVFAPNSMAENDKILVAEVQVTYIGNDASATFPFFKVSGQSGAWSNASDYSLITSINANFTCKKGETATFYTTIPVKEIMFSKFDWKRIQDRKYELVFSTYPVIVSIELN